jgi:hypothetical protein
MTITIDAANGTEFSCGDIGGANCWLDVIEHKQPIQFSTACGIPLWTINAGKNGNYR